MQSMLKCNWPWVLACRTSNKMCRIFQGCRNLSVGGKFYRVIHRCWGILLWGVLCRSWGVGVRSSGVFYKGRRCRLKVLGWLVIIQVSPISCYFMGVGWVA